MTSARVAREPHPFAADELSPAETWPGASSGTVPKGSGCTLCCEPGGLEGLADVDCEGGKANWSMEGVSAMPGTANAAVWDRLCGGPWVTSGFSSGWGCGWESDSRSESSSVSVS